MIDKEKYKEILEKGLILDHYFLLCTLKKNEEVVKTKRIQGFINLLSKKGYLTEDLKLTEKAEDIMITGVPKTTLIKHGCLVRKQIDLGDWGKEIHKKCQEKLVELTGKSQVTSKIDKEKKGYAFLCNAVDLSNSLSKMILKYSVKDFELIEKTMLRHIEVCNDTGNWFPLMHYYVLKNGTSQLYTDMTSNEEKETSTFTLKQKLL